MDKPAFPNTVTVEAAGDRHFPGDYGVGGLSRRELFAAMAMQGILAATSQGATLTERTVASEAVAYADALIAAFGTEPPK